MAKLKKRVFDIIQIGNKSDVPSTLFDVFIVIIISLNLFATFFSTFRASEPYTELITQVEYVTTYLFTIEYILRVWTADLLYPNKTKLMSRIAFIFSFYGLVDFLTFFPTYLPFMLPGGAVAFRIFRVFRILRLFKINAQYDAFNVIIEVLKEKKDQIISSICMIMILMLASSLCMYSLEHEAQPENFENAFSGMWWSVSTLLTVGYGDIYPITILGKIMAILIAFLGVGMVAIPTGIISAGFVEHYSAIKARVEKGEENSLKLYQVKVNDGHKWCGQKIRDLNISRQEIVVLIERKKKEIVPNDGEFVIKKGDIVYIFDKCQDGYVGTGKYY